MRRAAHRRSTLFVLTTREYILRQAAQMYERLEQESVDGRRFLLELSNYSRVDRARIFANHAFHSTDLTAAAKRELLEDKGYARIIDHPNYNPRTIEWITGMASHRLSPDDLGNYVGFALESLSHPERIWQHAFENELDDYGRLTLFALATLPNGVELEHLERSFEDLCRHAGLPVTARAFERTLSMLDDSFVRTFHDEDPYRDRGILVRPYDPSVIDFLSDYLRRSPGDVLQVLEAATFFEQVEWLFALLRTSATPISHRLAHALVAATMRTFDAPGVRTVTVPVGPNSWTFRPRGTRDVEARLLVAKALRDAYSSDGLGQWWHAMLEARRAQWRLGEGEPPSLLRLLRAIDRTEVEDFPDMVGAAKHVMTHGWSYVQNLEWLIELRSDHPDAFESDEWSSTTDEFEGWLASDFRSAASDMSTVEEVSAIERIAEKLGVEIDEDDLEEVRGEVEEAIAEQERAVEQDDEWESDERAPGTNEDQEIEAIFTRLADQ